MDMPPDRIRRRLIAAASAAPLLPLLSACAGTPGTVDGPPAPAPVYKVGDRWIYSGRDGFRDPLVWEETREVIAVAPGAIDIRVTWKGNRVDSARVERWTSPGDLPQGGGGHGLVSLRHRRCRGTSSR